jgi:hypothetical protein
MRRPKPQPIDTQLLRLRNARVPKRTDRTAQQDKSPRMPTPRVSSGRTFRLRNVHRD